MSYGMSGSEVHPVAHHVGATGVRSGTGLKRTIPCFTKVKSCCLMRRPRGIASLLAGVVLMSLKAFLQVIGVAKWQLSVGNNVGRSHANSLRNAMKKPARGLENNKHGNLQHYSTFTGCCDCE